MRHKRAYEQSMMAGVMLVFLATACTDSPSARVTTFNNVCLKFWWVHSQAACAEQPQACPGALVARSLAADGNRVDVPIDRAADGRLTPRLDQARLVPFQVLQSHELESGVVISAAGERQTLYCRGWGEPPFVNGKQAGRLPSQELQEQLLVWDRQRLEKVGLDPMGRPLGER
jgi:hypothetical protein